jgi:hypothetical protein
MPEIITLPTRGRERGLIFKDEQLDEIHADLAELENGQAVVVSKVDVDGKPFTKDGAARNYARAFANAYQDRFAAEADTEDDGTPRRMLSTHAIAAVNSQGKPNGKFIAAVSNNTREVTIRRSNEGPPRSDLMREVREWRKAHPRDRSFRNYTNWDYDTLRERVNKVTGYNDGIYVPPTETPENGANAAENVDSTGLVIPENTNAENGGGVTAPTSNERYTEPRLRCRLASQ